MREIRIRQMRYEEARMKLEAELNDAFIAGELRVSVLHGIGTGVLKKMTAEAVRECGYARVVTTLVNENPGVTLVDLDPPDRSAMGRYMG